LSAAIVLQTLQVDEAHTIAWAINAATVTQLLAVRACAAVQCTMRFTSTTLVACKMTSE
jgi:hypothetical protein